LFTMADDQSGSGLCRDLPGTLRSAADCSE
jgi:hypothetical protein